MPRISYFYGIGIYMYFSDHGEPHVHAEYGEYDFKISISSLEIIKGRGPKRCVNLVRDWIKDHRQELYANWRRCRRGETPEDVAPLD